MVILEDSCVRMSMQTYRKAGSQYVRQDHGIDMDGRTREEGERDSGDTGQSS